ncbi:Uncharacterized membrane protein YgaE, UPF0421/DUF939 family [Seinonella peptonophila]|uniref:Uncharacterized membrane protein YgaE, UPF0421/DUF939 family n=1 Tax=Seinonella peptonophila TaxID=112248 RepID=A0A1M5AK43_9BACL|nr:aromatic acid exporter family protein [Seinonella peptonophila]SHF30670.1 Uncharacterized membrane protein YgaE, UPF0421/DUF939 family [Seinonella peptonophila]
MKIGYRVLKTALGAGISVALAQLIGLQSYATAGMITILCVKRTKKASLRTAGERLLACLLGLFFAGLFFELLGFYAWVISVILLVLIPICVYLGIVDGVVTSLVIILQIYSLHHFGATVVWNQLSLMLIGIGVALILNLYMPSLENDLKKYQQDIETKFKRIFEEFIIYLREGTSHWDGAEIVETEELLKKAKELASKEEENHLTEENDSYAVYFRMRERQFEIIVRLVPIISSLDHTHPQGKRIADFLEQLKDAIHPGNTAQIHLDRLKKLRETFKNAPLPTSHDDFATCASLYHFINEMERYLIIKKSTST